MLPYALQGIGPGKSAVWAGLFALLSPSLATANAGNDQIVLIVSTAVGASDSAIARAPCWDEAPPDARVLCRPETREHAGTIGIRLTTSNGQPAKGRITADYATFEITATSPGDYIHRQSMLVIEDGEVGSRIEEITLLDDNVAEETETFGVRVTNFVAPPQYSLTYDHSIETILDNDRETTFFDLSASPSIISEDEGATSVEVTATADGNVLDTQTTITVSVSGSGANIAVAFEPVSDFTITVPANERSGSARFTLTPVDDEVLQVSETVVLAGTVPGLAVNGTTLRLVDNEVLTFAVADASGPEDGPPLAFEVSLGVEVVLPTEVVYQTEAWTATYFWDYEVTVGVLTFAPGEKSKTVNVRLIDDSLYEDDEKFELVLLYTSIGGISYHRLQVSGTGTIIDDDKPPVIQAVHASANEGDQLLFEVKLEGESELPALVEYATSDGTATEGDDYLPAAGTLTFSPGEQSHTITVSTINDDIVEGREDVALTLLRAEDATLDPSSREAVGTIIDDDTVSLTVADAAAVEDGAALAFRVTLSPSSPLAVTADFATSDTTAIAGEDYEAASGTLTFPAGTTSATVLVEVLDDSIYEEEETLTLAFSNAANADAPDKPATGTIRDDDDPPDIVVDPASALEGGGPLAFTVRLTETSGAQATVSYRTSPGSASAGSDYTPVSGNLTFEPGDTRRTIEVALLDDDVDEADETFSVTLTAANGATLGRSTAQGTIRDDDLPAVSVRALTASVVEGAPATFEVTVAGIAAPATGVRVRLTGIGGFLVSGPTTRTIAFVAGSKTARLVAPTEDDARDEPDGEVTATLVAGSGYRIGTPSSATAAVLDNDQRAVLVQPTALAVVEGAQSSYTIGLASEPSGEVAVAVTVPGSTDVSVAPAAVTFTAIDWQTPRRITVSAAEDDDILADAPVRLAHAAKGADYDGTTGDSVTVTVVENDSAAFWIGDVSAAESDGMLRFVVSLSVASPATATVDYATMDGSATADSDYRATAGTLTFLPGETSKTVVVDLHDDDLHEADETLRVTLSNAVDAAIAKVAGTGTIADDDSAPVLAVGDAMAVESAGRISFPITMDGATGDNVTIAYATEDATAAAGADYLAASGSLTFASGEISKTVTVTLLDDSRYEADETFRMTLASPVNAVVDKDAGTGTITDDDEPPVLAVADMSASENAGTMAFEVTLREVAATRVAVDYATADATALAGQDYSATAGTLAFLPGETTRTIIVPLLDDALHEMDETFRVTLANPAGAIVADDEATGTITDDDEAATLSVGDQSAVESLGEIVFEISLAGQSAMPVTVEYATANGTANAQEDYEATTGTLTFDPGERSQTITVPLLDDAVHEATETFQLELSSPFGANLAHGVGTGTITDDDPVPRLTARDATASEDAGELTFEIVMTGESDRPATVDYATSDDTALAAADYEAISGTLTFVPGESSKTIAVPLLDDEVHEADETLFLTLASPDGAVVDKDAGTGTITDDDEPPVLAVADMSASENAGTMAFEVTLREVAATRVAVDYATADATALAGQDYSATAGTLAFLPGETTRTIIVPLLDDALHEMDETFRVTLANPVGAIVADDEAIGTITDDDEAATLSVGDQSAVESLGEIVFEISLAGQSAMPVTVEYATANGTANAQEDYEATTGTLTFDPGERSQTITVPLLDDAVHEATETFQLELSSPFGANLAHGVGTGTITDDDPVPRLTARDATASEDAGELTFEIVMTGESDSPATVDYATSDDTALAAADYEAISGTLTFVPGESSKTIAVPLLDDEVHEADETLFLTLASPDGAVVDKDAGTGTITDDDEPPVLAVADMSASENAGTMAFEVTLREVAATRVAVDYATADATALAGQDYSAAAGTLAFLPGETTRTIIVPLLDDALHEMDETFRVTLANPVGAIVADDEAIGTITDDDEPPVLAVADMSASENAGTMAFEVTLREVAATRVAVDYATADATALAGQDYSAAAGTLAFLPGETTRTIIVPLLDDALHEMDETFRVTLANPVGAIVADDEATGTITDDDEAATLSVGDQSAVESLGEIVFEISLAGQSAMPVTVEYATANGTANAQEDYEATTGTLTFDPGERSQTITVPLLDDAVHEATETFQLELSSPFGANLAHGVGTGTITDDDPVPRLTARDATASEDAGELTFEIVMTGESDSPATVDYATSDDTALAAADYEAISGTLTFVPGESSKTIAVPLLDDEVHEADETLFLTLASPDGAVVDKDAGTGTITDDDEPPVLAVADMSASENAGTMAFEVTLRGVAATRVAVDYATADATALAGQDYSATAGTLAFLPGETTRTIIVPLLDDALHEMDETFRVTLANPVGAIVADDEATGTITDDDEAATLSVGDQSAVESLGEIVFEISLAGQSAMPVTVEYATANGTANAQEDYEATTGTLTFDPGERSQTITVPLLDDAVHEATETFQLELSSPFGANLAHGVGTGTITDDDPVPRLTARDATASEDAGELTFEIVMTGESDSPATVDYATSDDTALAAADYEAISGTLTFVPGESSKTIAVPLLDDEVHEADETLFLTLASPDGATLPTAADADATGTITNDDGEPTLAVADATASEDVGKLAFVIAMTGASDRPATVDYATSDGTATATQDYVATAGTLTFAPGEASKAIVVRVLGDTLPEPDETLQMTLSNAAGAAVADGVGMGTIQDDDETPPETARPIDDMVIALGTTRDLNLTPHFVGVPTSYSAQAANEAVGVSVDGAVLTVHGNAVGAAEVTVTAANGAGEATQTFTVTVVAPPTALRTLPQMALCVGGEPRSVDLATYFDGSSLRYSAMVSDPNTASVTLDGTTLAVAPRNEGVATVTVTAGNALGEASQVFGVTVVKDEAELAAAEAALAAVARSLLASIGDAVAERLRGSRRASRPAAQDLGPGHRYAHLAAARSNPFDEPTTDFDTGSGLAPDQGRQQLRRLPPFSLSVAAADAPSSTAYWVRGDWRRFESRDGDNQRDGTLGTLHLGIDRSFGRAVVGIAASLFAAQVDYRFERSSAACGTSLGKGLLETDLVGVHPYASWPIGRGKMWAFLGAGRGDVALRRCDSERGQETDLAMRMASLGGRWPLGRASTEGVAWSVVQDVGMVRLETGDHAGPLHKRSVTATRVRVGIEAIRSAGSARPFLSVMARHDGGDGETGGGLEVAGGLRYEHPVRRLEITAEGRALAVHSAQVRREFGIALSAMVPPRTDLTGFSLKVESRFGADARRSNPLWGNAMPWDTPSRQALARQVWTMGWDIGYGFRTHAGVATPFVELDAGPTGRAAALGTRYRFAAGPDQIDIELSGGVEERLGGVHTHIAIRAALHF